MQSTAEPYWEAESSMKQDEDKHIALPDYREYQPQEMRRRARQFYKGLRRRRSVRHYSDRPVPREVIEDCVRAASTAPSGANMQPWHFVVIDDPALMDKIMEVHPHARMLQTASHAIVVCGDELLQHDDGYWVVDCGAATQNMLLAAETMGLGACWVGLHPREKRKMDSANRPA